MISADIGGVTYGHDVSGFASTSEIGEYGYITKHAQISAFCASLVIESWTLFEALSEDLWMAALNAHPTVLGELTGRPRSKFKTKDKSDSGQPGKSQSVIRLSFDQLQKWKFDVHEHLGTILKKSDNIGFRSIYEIRDSFHRAFRKQNASIDEILDDDGLQYAAAVRNVIIHKQGIVDSEYFEQTALLKDLPALKEGDRFPLTGKICAEIADSCRICSCWLVNAVHGWIIGHPEA